MSYSGKSVRIIGFVLLSAILVLSVSGCRSLFGRNTGPIDAFAFLPQSNPALTQPVQGAINNRPDPKEITIVVPPGTDLSRLVATITLNTEATVTVISTGQRVPQRSGISPNNFSVPVTYAIEIPGEDQPVLYTVRVREASTNARLIDLSVAGSSYQTPTFGPTVMSYEAEVPFASESVQVNARAEDPKAFAISINGIRAGGGQASAAVDFSSGDSVDVTVEVVAEDQQTRQEYHLTILRGEPDRDSNLASLSVSEASMDQVFRADRRTYSAVIPYGADQVTVVTQTASEFSTVRVNDVPADGTGTTVVALDPVQKQTADIVVTAQDGSSTIYSLTLTRAAPDATVSLAEISVSAGKLSPAFSQDETVYAVTLAQDQSSVTITTRAASDLTALQITSESGTARQSADGSAGQIALSIEEGKQALVIVTTTAENGATRDYRISVSREIGMNSVVLSELAMSGAAFTPAFDPMVTAYTASVPADTDVVQVSATPLDESVQIFVGDHPYPRRPATIDILLFQGTTVKTPITLRAPNGLERVYTLAVTRPAVPSRIGRRILEVSMDELRLSRMVASSLNNTKATVDAEARIRVRYHGESEIIYEDFAPITTEKSRSDILVSMNYRSQFIDMDLGRYLDIEIAIPTTAGRYLHYNKVAFADGSLTIRPEFLVLSDQPGMDWPQPGTPRPVTARVLYQISDAARTRVAALGDAFALDNQGEFPVTLELIDLSTGKSLGVEVMPAKPGSMHGRGIELVDGLELPEGGKIGYVLTATTRDGRLLRDHGVTEVRTLDTFENGDWEYASLFVDSTLDLVEDAGT